MLNCLCSTETTVCSTLVGCMTSCPCPSCSSERIAVVVDTTAETGGSCHCILQGHPSQKCCKSLESCTECWHFGGSPLPCLASVTLINAFSSSSLSKITIHVILRFVYRLIMNINIVQYTVQKNQICTSKYGQTEYCVIVMCRLSGCNQSYYISPSSFWSDTLDG